MNCHRLSPKVGDQISRHSFHFVLSAVKTATQTANDLDVVVSRYFFWGADGLTLVPGRHYYSLESTA